MGEANRSGTKAGAQPTREAIAPGIEIERNPERCSGNPTLAGTRHTIHDIVADVQRYGGDVQRVVDDFPHLTVELVEAVMAWYCDRPEEVDEILRRRREEYQRLLAQGRGDRTIAFVC
jgi:uncharacterized protein (DUF433 family)